jgi:hypothetical protein
VVLGIAASCVLIAVSALLNYRMGYRSADTELDGIIYGSGAGAGDLLKAVAPFVIFWGWKHKDYLAALSAAALYVVISGYSLTAALGFAAQHRAHKDGENLGVIEKRGDLRRQLGRAEARLAELGTQRTPLEVAEAINGILKRPIPGNSRTVSEQSAQCTLNRKSTREACAEIAGLRTELARAQEAERLAAESKQIRKDLDATNTGSVVTMADPQVEALTRTAKVATLPIDRKDVEFGLAWLLALFIELGSGLGLYVSTTPWRSRSGEGGGRKGKQERNARPGLGAVDSYVLERLERVVGEELKFAEIFMDYQAWCRWQGATAFNRDMFDAQLAELAEAAGISIAARHRVPVMRDVGFVRVLLPAAAKPLALTRG